MEDSGELQIKRPRLLEECLRCTICMQFVTPPVLACQREHLICEKCLTQCIAKGIDKCGICFGEFNIRCRNLETITEAISAICQFGCGQRVALAVYDHHLTACEERPFDCPYGCQITIPKFTGVAKHLVNKHGAVKIEQWKHGKFSYNSSNVLAGSHENHARDLTIMTYESRTFLVEERLNGEFNIYVVRLMSSENEATRYRVKVSVRGMDRVNKFSVSLHVHSMRMSFETLQNIGQAAEVPISKVLQWSEPVESGPHE